MKYLIILSFFALINCSNRGTQTYTIDPTRRYEVNSEHDKEEIDKPESTQRKLIYNINYEIAVRNRDSANVQLVKIAQFYGGYVLQLGTRSSIIRIPAEKLDSSSESFSKLGTIASVTKSAKDVTNEYYDTHRELENLVKTRLRYLEILEKATTVTEVLGVERELARVNIEIDKLTGRMERLKHLLAFSTITIVWEDLYYPGIIGYIGYYTWSAISWFFIR